MVTFSAMNLWLVLTVVLVVLDWLTGTRLWFALPGVGAVVAAFAASVHVPLWVQIGLCLGVAGLLLGLARPRLVALRERTLQGIAESLAWYRAQPAEVVEAIAPHRAGKVSVAGCVLPARATRRIAAGDAVEIVAVGPDWIEVSPLPRSA